MDLNQKSWDKIQLGKGFKDSNQRSWGQNPAGRGDSNHRSWRENSTGKGIQTRDHGDKILLWEGFKPSLPTLSQWILLHTRLWDVFAEPEFHPLSLMVGHWLWQLTLTWNYGIILAGKDLQDHRAQPLTDPHLANQTTPLSATALNISRDGESHI